MLSFVWGATTTVTLAYVCDWVGVSEVLASTNTTSGGKEEGVLVHHPKHGHAAHACVLPIPCWMVTEQIFAKLAQVFARTPLAKTV